MPEIILHHYPQSPVSEKVRIVLGMKRLAWRSVIIPRLPPKPDLMPLTGGYRLTPVMQIGADIYCDSQCIIRELERRFPEPTLFPGGSDGMAWGVSRWTDGSLFQSAITVVFGSAGKSLPDDFAADRGALYFGPDFEMGALEMALPQALGQLRAQFGWMEMRLATGRHFMLGAEPGLPDALCYYLVWFIRSRYGRGPDFLAQFEKLCAWERRVEAIGHGSPSEMDSGEALAIARDSQSTTVEKVDPLDPQGFKPGDAVEVMPDVPRGGTPVVGRILSLDAQEIVLRRRDEQVGEVAVHFPRVGSWLVGSFEEPD